MQTPHFRADHFMHVGIDVSKAKLDVALQPHDKGKKGPHKVFENTKSGHKELLKWLQSHRLSRIGALTQKGEDSGGEDPESLKKTLQIHICLEATGPYAEPAAIALADAGLIVSLVNPSLVHAFGQSLLKRTKTDKADAELIAHFCATHQPPAWQAPSLELRELQSLVRRIETLQEMKQMEENRLAASLVTAQEDGVAGETVRESLRHHISYLKQQLEDAEKQTRQHVKAHPQLEEHTQLLQSVPGIGFTTAVVLLAEMGDYTKYRGARQVAAFAGLVPRLRESGSSVRGKPRLSKLGSARLRRCLYFPAMTALRCNPLIVAMGDRLSAQGKAKMLIIGAAMRKLLHIAYGVLKSGVKFDPKFNDALNGNFKTQISLH